MLSSRMLSRSVGLQGKGCRATIGYEEEPSIARGGEEQLDVKMDVKLDMELDMKTSHGRARGGRNAREGKTNSGPVLTGRPGCRPTNRSWPVHRIKLPRARSKPVVALCANRHYPRSSGRVAPVTTGPALGRPAPEPTESESVSTIYSGDHKLVNQENKDAADIITWREFEALRNEMRREFRTQVDELQVKVDEINQKMDTTNETVTAMADQMTDIQRILQTLQLVVDNLLSPEFDQVRESSHSRGKEKDEAVPRDRPQDDDQRYLAEEEVRSIRHPRPLPEHLSANMISHTTDAATAKTTKEIIGPMQAGIGDNGHDDECKQKEKGTAKVSVFERLGPLPLWSKHTESVQMGDHEELEDDDEEDKYHRPRWCPDGLSRSQKRRVQRLRALEEAERLYLHALRKARPDLAAKIQQTLSEEGRPQRKEWRPKQRKADDETSASSFLANSALLGYMKRPWHIWIAAHGRSSLRSRKKGVTGI
ncbi:hypothetical protein QYE76_047774 [Lolium multiflorum]|uniref:Uncharacterized protein n=1 Tax=Lolium multiflorum TaxID=4521 RepID=A0AAD8X1W4_LOLMU|nr:hypothetical protein QYE76_047774 [Lolium multiflorum]